MNYSRSNQQVTRTPDTHDNVTDATFASAYTQAATALGVVEKIQIDGAAFNDAMSRGKQEAWATCYAKQIAQGATKQEAKNYANQAENAGWEKELWQNAFELIKKKYVDISNELASLCADAYVEQRVKGESAFYAMAYTKRLVLDEKTPDEASQYATEAEMDSASAAAVPEIEPESRNHSQKFDRAMRAELPVTLKLLLENSYAGQVKTGKNDRYAAAYSTSIMGGLSPEEAKMYAENFFKLGKSFSWTTIYNTQLIMGQPKNLAWTAADEFIRQMWTIGNDVEFIDTFFFGFYCFVLALNYSPESSFRFAVVASEKLREHAKPLAWAVAYTRKHVLEYATVEESVEYADNIRATQSDSVTFSEASCDMFEQQMEKGKTHEQAGTYTLGHFFIMEGMFPDIRTMRIYATTRKNQLSLGNSKEWASAYALKIAQDQSSDYAESFALVYEMQREDDRSVESSREYADQVAQGRSPDYAESFALIYEIQRDDNKPIEWCREYAGRIASGASPEDAQIAADTRYPNDI